MTGVRSIPVSGHFLVSNFGGVELSSSLFCLFTIGLLSGRWGERFCNAGVGSQSQRGHAGQRRAEYDSSLSRLGRG